MKLLVDTGVVSSSNFLVGDSQEQELEWGKKSTRLSIAGFKRVELDPDLEQQREKDALFTIGRLTRAGRIALYTYSELAVENWRRPRGKEPLLNALNQCPFHYCPAAIERSKFRSTLDTKQWIAKGGSSDARKGFPSSEFSQIPYFDWLSSLSAAEIAAFVSHASMLRLDVFEVTSLQELPWFQTLARALTSRESLPDCFHVWTARRNGLDVFLTLEKKLPRTIEQLKNRRRAPIDVGVAVLRPTALLEKLGVTEIDAVPIDPGRFYTYMEIFQISDRMLRGKSTITDHESGHHAHRDAGSTDS
jgi:hypothetical protein